LDDILANILVILILAVLGGGIFFFVRRRQAEAGQKLAQMAGERGWQIETVSEPLAWGVRITGRGWTLAAISRSSGAEAGPGSSNIAMSTLWRADAPGSTILISARLAKSDLDDLGGAFSRRILEMALDLGANGLAEVQVGSEALRQKYRIWAQHSADAQACLTPAVEAALLAWKGTPPRIKRDRSGLQIELSGERLKNPIDLLAFIRIGEAFLAA
jgi:hypothetical protein